MGNREVRCGSQRPNLPLESNYHIRLQSEDLYIPVRQIAPAFNDNPRLITLCFNRDGRHGRKGKNSTTCSTPIHPTTSSVTRFILLTDSSTQNSPKTVTKKLQEQWVPAYYTTPPPTTTERDVSALTLQLTFDTRNPDFPAQGLGSRPGPTHWALARNLTISWSMASGLTRLGTIEPKIV